MSNQNKKHAKRFRKPSNRRPKEFEVNVQDADVNMEDLRGKGDKPRRSRSKTNDNDYTWYTHYPALVESSTGVNFGEQVGSELRWNPSLLVQDGTVLPYSVSGICSIHFVPTLGAADDNIASPAMKVATQMYAAMRMKLGSTASYDATDTMLYLGAMDSAYMIYTLGLKIYGLLRIASPFNNYIARNLCNAMGFDYQSFYTNIANFKMQLDAYGVYLTARLVPGSFDIIRRHCWLVQNLFTDSETAKAQIYGFVPDGYYTYTEATSGPGYLKWNAMPFATTKGAKVDYAAFMNIIQNIYEALTSSSDIDQMSADIGKAFEGDLFSINIMPDDYITPINPRSREVLSQIENCVLCGRTASGTVTVGTNTYNAFDIYQSQSLPKSPRLGQLAPFEITLSAAARSAWSSLDAGQLSSFCLVNRLLNFHWMNPTNEDILVASRGVPGALTQVRTNSQMQAHGYGSELYSFAEMFEMQSDGSISATEFSYLTIVSTSDANEQSHLLASWSQFDWAPTFFMGVQQAEAAFVTYFLADIDNYALPAWIVYRNMNTNCVLSEMYSNKFPQVLN